VSTLKGSLCNLEKEDDWFLSHFWICRIVRKLCTNGLESVEVAKDRDLSAILIKEEKRLSANAYLVRE
jgi:hypothetical protein